MSKIYKYADISSARLILESSSVKLNNPNNYNDPFDSVIDFDESDEQRTLEIITEFQIMQNFEAIISKQNTKCNSYFKQSMKKDILKIKSILNSCKENKYFDCDSPKIKFLSKRTLSNWKKYNHTDIDVEFTNGVIDNIKSTRSSVLISCFSKIDDSLLMWSHYADKHKGVCIEFEKPGPEFMDVEYSTKRTRLNLEKIIRRILGYNLSNNNNDSLDEETVSDILKPFYTKAKDWDYEKEIRCVYSSTVKNDNIYEKDGIHLLKMPNITKVIFGFRASQSDIDSILSLIQRKDIVVEYMVESNSEYKVIKKQQNISK